MMVNVMPSSPILVDSRQVLVLTPVSEVVNFFTPVGLVEQVKLMHGSELILSRISDEEICDYLIRLGYNVEM